MKKEIKTILPLYKIAYAVAFIIILGLIRRVTYTHEVGVAMEAPFAILTAVFCADTYMQEIISKPSSSSAVSDEEEGFLYTKPNHHSGSFFNYIGYARIWTVFYLSKSRYTSDDKK